MTHFLEWLTVIFSLFLTYRSLKRISASSIYIVQIWLVFLFVVPMILDLILGVPEYLSYYRGFELAVADDKTRKLYCLFVCLIQLPAYYHSSHNVSSKMENNELMESNILFSGSVNRLFLLSIMMAAPLIIVLFGSNKSILFSWGWRYSPSADSITKGVYGSAELFTYIGASASLLALFDKNNKNIGFRMLALVLLYFNVCIQGKRGIFLFASIMIVYMIVRYQKSISIKTILVAIAGVFVAIYVSIFVQMDLRSGSSTNTDAYMLLRIDFFRDDTVKMAIYAMLNPDKIKILDYPGQSFVSQVGFLFPLNWMDSVDKTAYDTLFTEALIRGSGYEMDGSQMTTSIFDSMFANFGWLGFVIGPLIVTFSYRLIDRQSFFIRPIYWSAFVLSTMFSFNCIAWYYEFWLIFIYIMKQIKPIRIQVRV